MAGLERDRLLELARQGICPNCGKTIAEGTSGSGTRFVL